MDSLVSIIVLIISASSAVHSLSDEGIGSEVPDLSRHLTLPSVEAINYYGTGVGITRSRFSRPVRQVKFGGPGYGPIPVIGGNSHSASQAQAASLNLGPFGASISTANSLSNSHAGGYPGIGSHFGGPIGYGGPGFGNSHSHASAAASSGGGGGFFGGPGFSQSQAAASAGSSGFGGGYPYGGGLGYPGGFGGGYGYPGGFGGYPGGNYGHHGHHGHGYPGGFGGYPGGFGGYPGGFGGNYGLYPGGHGHHGGGAFLGYGRGGLRSGGNGVAESKATAGTGVSSDAIKF